MEIGYRDLVMEIRYRDCGNGEWVQRLVMGIGYRDCGNGNWVQRLW